MESADTPRVTVEDRLRAGLLRAARHRVEPVPGQAAVVEGGEATLKAAPLSFAQERLWFLEQLEPASAAYHVARAFRLRGLLCTRSLVEALGEVVHRQPALRTAIERGSNGEPRQVVKEAWQPGLPVVDLLALGDSRIHPEPNAKLEALAEAEALRPFVLGSGRLMRAAQVVVGQAESVLFLTFHHLATDAASMAIFYRELAWFYRLGVGRPASLKSEPPLPALTTDPASLAADERRRLDVVTLERLASWWLAELVGAPRVLEVPTDRPRPAVASLAGRGLSHSLAEGLADQLTATAARLEVTPFAVMLALLATWVGRASGQRDLLVGTPVANRPRRELEAVMGLFVNTAVVRLSTAGDPMFEALVRRVWRATTRALSHQELPFEKLVEALAPPRDLSRSAVFQLMLLWQNEESAELVLPGVAVEPVPRGRSEAKFDLSLAVIESSVGLKLHAQYATDLFDPTTIRRWLGELEALLGAALATPERRLSELSSLSPVARHQLIAEWNDTQTTGSGRGEGGLAALCLEAAARTPDAVAASSPAEAISHAELERRVWGIAGWMLAQGVGAEEVVGVALPRGLGLLETALGVIAAGGVYLPLDLHLPEARRHAMLADAGATRVLTEPAGGFAGGRVGVAAGWLLPTPAPEAGVYVIFTSGSTGRPKGVLVSHRAVVRRILWGEHTYPLLPGDRVMQSAGLGFDFSIWELFAPLSAGAQVVFPSPEADEDPARLADDLAALGVTVAHFVPSLLAAFLDTGRLGEAGNLRLVFAGGEPLPEALAERFSATSRAELWNQYGPTEATIDATCWPRVSARPASAGRSGMGGVVPIGRVIDDLSAWVVDSTGQLAPQGVPGELWLAGVGLARGYLHQPAQTAARFVPDSFSARFGARCYRTGDRVRTAADGRLEFQGRLDGQVKLRGIRIEVGEIEAALLAHPRVAAAAVMLRRPEGGEPRLVAYLAGAGLPGAEEVRAFLARRLPAAMLPTEVVALTALPVTAAGKIDRGALPDLTPTLPAAAFEPPRGPLEELLAALWSELLGVAIIGRGDHFFALGGHSLVALRLVSRLEEILPVRLPLRRVFELPMLADLAHGLALELARQAAADEAADSPAEAIEPADTEPVASFAEERLWFLAQLPGGNRAYNLPLDFVLRGPIEVAKLAAALGALVGRHEPLRTGFGEAAKPRVEAELCFVLPVVDLGALGPDTAAPVADRLAAIEATAPFDLGRPPLFRARLLRLGGEAARLVLTLHHIIGDGWSVGVLCRDLSELYAAGLEGRAPRLPELSFEVRDAAAQARRRLAAGRLDQALGWWRERLAGAPEVLDLPTDRARPAVSRLAGSRFTRRLPGDLATALVGTARRLGGTPFLLHLGAFVALLSRLSGQRQVVVGTAVAGREGREVENLLGCFVNSLALPLSVPTSVGGTASAELLTAELRQRVLSCLAHAELPFERLVEAVVSERTSSHHPLFQVFFTWSAAEESTLSLPGVTVRRRPAYSASSKLDFSLSVFETGEGLLATFEYATDLFDGTTVRRWAAGFERLLWGLTRPGVDLSSLPLLSVAEEAQLLREWSDTRSGPRSVETAEETLVSLWRSRAEQCPERVAVVDGETRLSYRVLAARVEVLAARLVRVGVGPEVRVGVSLPRSTELLVALLAVQRAGGAYVPLDPAYPEDRLTFMVEDSGAVAVVAGAAEWSRLPLDGLDRPPVWVQPHEVGSAAAWPACLPDHLAYLIYTSGSTGRPKAVAITHRSAVAMVQWARATFAEAAFDAVVWATSMAFDLSIFEIFVTLTVGGRLLVAENALALTNLPAAHEATLINTVPGAMAELVADHAVPHRVRVVNLAGEPLPGSLARRVYALPQELELWNLYGPSEDTTYSTGCRVPRPGEGPGGEGEPTIGRPLADTRALILGPRFELQPVGVPGELWLSGAGLARGYLGRPALTAERFMAHPRAASGGERAYRTGDLVRWLASGEMQFLGRLDHQVKIRGFRVELGEIEAAMLTADGVREVVVLARRDDDGPARLVAYLSAEEGRSLEAAMLKATLAATLPEYMVPSLFVVLPALPRLPNGKVDRKKLPAPRDLAPTEHYEPPGTELEELLASVWCELLKLDRVGVQDDFFALGGHSLLAGRVTARLRSLLGLEVPMTLFFERPRLGEMALALSGLQAGRSDRLELSWERAEPVPATFTQQTFWMFSELDPESPALNLVGTFRLVGRLDGAALASALTRVITRHEALRSGLELADGQLVQRVAPPWAQLVPVVDVSALGGAAEPVTEGLATTFSREPFDLRRAPLARLRLVRLPAGEHRLAAAIHHIVADGWSLGIFIAELSEAYAARVESRADRLPPLPLQYAEFASWQRRALAPERLTALLSAWKMHLDGAPPELEGLSDRPRPVVSRHRGDVVRVELPAALVLGLRRFSRQHGLTLYMTLLTAYGITLSLHGAGRRLSVGAPVAGRNRAELERLIGLFINLLALDLRLPDGVPLAGLAAGVKEEVLWAFAHQEMPFEVLAAELTKRGGQALHPLFQTLFVLQNIPRSEWVLPGVELSSVPTRRTSTALDLAFHLLESGDRIHGGLGYDSDLFDHTTVTRLVGSLSAVLGAMVEDPAQPVSKLVLLTPAERQQLVVEWSGAGETALGPSLLHTQVMQHWPRFAEAVAVVHGEERWSYQALDRASAAVAAGLVGAGVTAEARVGVFLERSFAQMAVLLGVMRSGAAALPFDARAPLDRLESVLADAGAVALVSSDPAVGERLASLSVLDAKVLLSSAGNATWRDGLADARQVVTVIYTSGSTGKPKGVMVEHRALARYVAGAVVAFGLTASDRVLQLASASFDTSAEEIYPTWSVGATLVLRDEETLASVAAFIEAAEAWELTVLDLPTAWWHQWVAQGGTLPSGLRLVILGGERAQRLRAEQWLAGGGRVRTLNTYGPTETTVVATSWRFVSRHGAAPGLVFEREVPIGRPVAGARTWVLDPYLQPVPRGRAGELVIGGSGLARGYLGDPGRTARLFVPNPLSESPGERMYRSGDRVRQWASGELEFLGRVDRQVKVRGFRVEPAEIETTLLAHGGLAAAVVVPWAAEGETADRLAVYLVAKGGFELDVEALRVWLKARLPEYLVPAAWVPLAELPMTTSGKVDVKRLPAPQAMSRPAARRAPESEVERFVALHWQAVLRLESVSLEDDFFGSGGHSLLATQLIARIERATGLRMPLRSLFDAPTLGEFSKRVEERLVGEE